MTDISALADAIGSAGPAPTLQRRMGKVVAINTNRTIDVQIAGSTTTITGVRYFAHFAPKLNTQVWLDTDGRDWIAIGAIAGLGGQVPTCKVYRTADYNIATGSTYTTIPWSAAEYDPYGMFTSGTNIVVPLTGRYLVTAQVEFNGNATGYRGGALRTGGSVATNFSFAQMDAGTTNLFSFQLASVRTMVAGDYFQLLVRQGSGVTIALAASTIAETSMTITYLGPDA